MTRPDFSQGQIIAGLRAAGITVWVIGTPCDLLTYYPPRKRWLPIECKPAPEPGILVKTRAVRIRKDQERQAEFLATYAVPVVRTVQEAIEAITRSIP